MRKRAGFTLIETIVSLMVLGIVLSSLFATVLRAQRSHLEQRERLAAEQALRTAEYTIMTVLRMAGSDPFETKQALLDPDPLGHGAFDNLRTVSDFHPADGDFTGSLEDVLLYTEADTLYVRWQAGGSAEPVASPVRALDFKYYASDGTLMTNRAQTVGATQVELTLSVPVRHGSAEVDRRTLWVYLRNRR